jgi:hypothetical protein
VLSARTLRELARLLSDLPDHRAPEPGRFPAPARPRPAAGTRWADLRMPAVPCVPAVLRRPGILGKPAPGATASPPPAGTRWALLQSLVAPADC